jgi:hypothetical protein
MSERTLTPINCAYYYEVSDNCNGTLIVLNVPTICHECGGCAQQEMSYTWGKTKNIELLTRHGYGVSIKHYSTVCGACGYDCYG